MANLRACFKGMACDIRYQVDNLAGKNQASAGRYGHLESFTKFFKDTDFFSLYICFYWRYWQQIGLGFLRGNFVVKESYQPNWWC